eukprot:5457095-Alexandrium_andersonii.AAC.1
MADSPRGPGRAPVRRGSLGPPPSCLQTSVVLLASMLFTQQPGAPRSGAPKRLCWSALARSAAPGWGRS